VRIRVSRNGPYFVSGRVPLANMTIGYDAGGFAYRWRKGREFPVPEKYALCRCGRSKTKPFCDQSHTQVGFDGTESASRKPYLKTARRLRGACLDLTDAEELCASAGFCLRAGDIWNLMRRTRNPGKRRTVIAEGRNCPAGRLVVWTKDGQAIEPETEPGIALVRDPRAGMFGPLWVRGGIPVISAAGFSYEVRNRVTLCRCGESANKPFCDGSHTHDQPCL
jgi:CDGSH-type Zn-finger protein